MKNTKKKLKGQSGVVKYSFLGNNITKYSELNTVAKYMNKQGVVKSISTLFPTEWHSATKFVIFHGSYPYMSELTVLAKRFPNVYIDICWMHIISPAASRQYLEEWLLTVPSNKIMAFGGDFGEVVEGTYGHSEIARKNVAEVLTKLVGDGYYSEEDAILIAKRIFRENALELYKLKKVGDYFERTE